MSVRPEILSAYVNISFDGEEIRLPFSESTTVAQIKQVLKAPTCIKPHLQILTFGPQVLRDEMRLTELGVSDGDMLMLQQKNDTSQNTIQVQVSNGLSSKTLRCVQGSSVEEFRRMVAMQYPGRGFLELEFNGVVLDSEKRLEDYNVSEGAQVRVVEQLEGGSE